MIDVDTVKYCWDILQQYIKKNDEAHAAEHLIVELLDGGLVDEDIEQLKSISTLFSSIVDDNIDQGVLEMYDSDEWDE